MVGGVGWSLFRNISESEVLWFLVTLLVVLGELESLIGDCLLICWVCFRRGL